MNEQTIFTAALELEISQRGAFLDEACGHSPELRQRIEKLLQLNAGAGHFMEQPAAVAIATIAPLTTERLGTQIGPYKLLQQIGEGGMGVVYMAEQAEPVKRKVALKVIKPGMDTHQVIARFEAERQALTIMDHVNIARVLDAGATETGRPYFVMELVQGVAITKYCDDNHLTPRQRLELFVPICQAIQHAHHKGIIHRDIKPSNVMITLYDGKPVPKVIDFGVAKAIEQTLTERTLFTQYGTLIGTLEYMSPEQAEMSALGVDTRSDIYSLGVLLYELLTGSTPLSRQRLKDSAYAEILRIIKEEDPPKPSTRLSDSGEALASISANRQTEPAKLTKLVRGELDWIVMKTLEKDRNRRYETANGFAADVQRYLADEPVQACPPSARYRLKKFARRNKGPVLAAAIVLLTLVGGIVGTTSALVWAVRERDDKAEALTAEATARKAEQQARVKALAGLRAMTDEIVENQMARGPQLAEENKEFLREIIKHFEGFAALTSGDAESRAIRAEGYARVGLMRHRLGELKEAETAHAEALALRKQLVAEFPTRPDYRQELARSHNNLGILLRETGRPKEAESAYAEAIVLRKQLVTDFPTRPEFRHDLAASQNNLGNLFILTTSRLKEAETAYAEALAHYKQLAADFPTRPEVRRDWAATYDNLGALLHDTRQLKGAETAFAEALALRKQLAADFPARPEFRKLLAESHSNLGTLLDDTGRPKDAEAAYAEALALQKQLVADFPTLPEYRRGLATTHYNLGILLSSMGKRPEAEAAYRQALDIREKLAADFPTVPEHRQDLAGSHTNLGILLSSMGKRSEAEAAYLQALEIWEKLVANVVPTVPEYGVHLGGAYCNFANLLSDHGQPEAALSWYQKAIAQLEPAVEGRVSPRQFLRNSYVGKARSLRALGRHAEAVRDWKRALEVDDGGAREDLGSNLAVSQLLACQQDRDAAGCLAAAADYETLKPTAAGRLYDAACVRAICAAVIPQDPKTSTADAARLTKEQEDLAMAWLHKAAAAGFTHAARLNEDKRLDALRERQDFKKLLAELQAKNK